MHVNQTDQQSLQLSLNTLHHLHDISASKPLRTEQDIPLKTVFIFAALILLAIFILIQTTMIPTTLANHFSLLISGFSTIYILIAGFAFCAIMAYFAGLVGSSTSPMSGLLVSALLIYSLILLLVFKVHDQAIGTVISISCLVVMGAALSISNDTMQDLKVGQLVGVTPWKQQLMLIIGVSVSALIIPLILQLLYNAYGIGGVFPRPNMDPQQMLSAPQAGLMSAIAKATFSHHVPWPMIITGAIVGIICICIDEYLKKCHQTRLPVLAVGLAIYLPLDSSVPVIIGGLLSHFIHKKIQHDEEKQHRGLLLSCGLVSGASLMGVLLAIPFALAKSTDVLRILPLRFEAAANVASFVVLVMLCVWFYKKVCY